MAKIRTRGVNRKLDASRSKRQRDRSGQKRKLGKYKTVDINPTKKGVQCPSCLWSGKGDMDFKSHWKERHAANPSDISTARRVSRQDIFGGNF